MLQSFLFTKTRKENPKDEESMNASLLIKAGYIHKEIAGVYSFLPLGLIVLNNISNIIREELNNSNCQEILMSSLQDPQIWQESNRWSDEVVDIWFKTDLKNGQKLGLAFTHEEDLTRIVKNHIFSYKDLPFYPYQIQTKFRNELRAKNGLLRGREFLMKDLYSFSSNLEEHQKFYNDIIKTYHKIYERLGIGTITFLTFADGGSFSKFSHEFQTVCQSGEDIIFLNRKRKLAINKEVYNKETLQELNLSIDDMEEVKSTEVGNIFTLNQKFSQGSDLQFLDQAGVKQFPFMGSYGIGISRIMGLLAEIFSDSTGLFWPENIAPFKIHILSFNENDKSIELYKKLKEKKVKVLLDERDVSPGQKLQESDLIGVPYRIICSEKSLASGGFEIKKRIEKSVKIISFEDLLNMF